MVHDGVELIVGIENNTLEYMDYLIWSDYHEQVLLIDYGWMAVPRWMAILTRAISH